MERQLTADQVLTALSRRRRLGSAVAAIAFAVAAAAVLVQPREYEAASVVRADTQRTHPDLVAPTVMDDLDRRMVTVRQELLARPVLERMIDERNLYADVVAKHGIDAAIEKMRGDLTVKPEGLSAFELTYRGRDPQVVAGVANRLPEIYAELAVDLRKAQAERATGLFADEVVALKSQLADAERQIAQVKVDHLGELPEQLDQNLREIESLGGQVRVKSEELRVAEGRRSDLVRSHAAGDTEAGRLGAAEDAVARALVTARTQWTADHPEVRRLEVEVEHLHARRALAEASMDVERSERSRATGMVSRLQGELTSYQKQVESYRRRLERTPRWAHELAVLARDYDVVKAKYQSVISRKVEAEISQELEARGAKNQLIIISPALVPSEPARPNRLNGLLVALVVAIVLGGVVSVISDQRDDSVRDAGELGRRLAIPVLAVVPEIGGGGLARRVLTPRHASAKAVFGAPNP